MNVPRASCAGVCRIAARISPEGNNECGQPWQNNLGCADAPCLEAVRTEIDQLRLEQAEVASSRTRHKRGECNDQRGGLPRDQQQTLACDDPTSRDHRQHRLRRGRLDETLRVAAVERDDGAMQAPRDPSERRRPNARGVERRSRHTRHPRLIAQEQREPPISDRSNKELRVSQLLASRQCRRTHRTDTNDLDVYRPRRSPVRLRIRATATASHRSGPHAPRESTVEQRRVSGRVARDDEAHACRISRGHRMPDRHLIDTLGQIREASRGHSHLPGVKVGLPATV